MRKPHGKMMGENIYGLGTMLYIDIENNENIFGHDGKSTPAINTAIRINPNTGDGVIILETGNPDLATKLASDWVFLETGKTDTLLFAKLIPNMILIFSAGLLLILMSVVGIGLWRKKRKTNAALA